MFKKSLTWKILREVKSYLCNFYQRIQLVVDEHFFDKNFGIETSLGYPLAEDKSILRDAVGYASTPPRILKKMTEQLKLNSEDIFVDIGCGKGRVLFYISTFKIKKIIGIELRKEILDITKRNYDLLKLKNTPVEMINADLGNYKLIEGTIFYFHYPFGEKTFARVISNIRNSIIENPRRIRIVCYHPSNFYIDLLNEQNWLKYQAEKDNDGIRIWENIWKSMGITKV